MATLNTMRAVLKDARMREQAGAIRKELALLYGDVDRLGTGSKTLTAISGRPRRISKRSRFRPTRPGAPVGWTISISRNWPPTGALPPPNDPIAKVIGAAEFMRHLTSAPTTPASPGRTGAARRQNCWRLDRDGAASRAPVARRVVEDGPFSLFPASSGT
jgi:hypothetical protein